MSRKKLNWRLEDGEHLVAAWGEKPSGPGWSNSLVCCLIKGADGKLREECLQKDEQTAQMLDLFPYSALAAADMTRAVKRLVRQAGNGRPRRPASNLRRDIT